MTGHESRAADYLDHMAEAISLITSYTDGITKDDFLADKRTQQAVILNLIVLGEAATKIVAEIPEFAAAHQGLPWQQMRGMRNRMAHGYSTSISTWFGKRYELPCPICSSKSKLSSHRTDRHNPESRRW